MSTTIARVQSPVPVSATSVGVLRRQCDCGASGHECEKKNPLQRKAARRGGPVRGPGIVHDVLRSPGQPLDRSTSAFMEARFGYDFSRVRVHADALAAESARLVHARAYTLGHHIVIGAGQPSPETVEGRTLLAHELTHTIQQAESGRSTGAPGSLEVGPEDDPHEREADAVAARVASGEPARGGFSPEELHPPRLPQQGSHTTPMVQRQSGENETQNQKRDEIEEGTAQATDQDLPLLDEAPELPGLLQRWSINGPAIATLNTNVCNGAGGIRVQLGGTGTADQTRCLSDCMRTHELSHASDALASDKVICKGKANGSQVNTAAGAEQKATEIKASNAELGCLRPQVAKVGVVCKGIIEDRIKQMEKYRDSFK